MTDIEFIQCKANLTTAIIDEEKKKHYSNILKKLRTLEIMKEKRVDMSRLMLYIYNDITDDSVEIYNRVYPEPCKWLTQEEMQLLKEALINEEKD